MYEGTLGFSLELAREPMSVVEVRRKAGQARLELAVALDSELRSSGVAERLVSVGSLLPAPHGRAAAVGLALHVAGARRTRRRARRSRRSSPSDRAPTTLLALRVCDPAVGSGAFLVAACRVLARARGGGVGRRSDSRRSSRERVLRSRTRCLFGVDRDPLGDRDGAQMALAALASIGGADSAASSGTSSLPTRSLGDFGAHFPEVARAGGFDAFVGNPPWVSYAGRAAQPLEPELRAEYTNRYRGFAGYRNLQGLFVERAATLLKPGGRLGFVLPSSMSELAGYAATRRAHDRWCAPDPELPDVGEGGFEGVFQPCMILLSTRRAAPLDEPRARSGISNAPISMPKPARSSKSSRARRSRASLRRTRPAIDGRRPRAPRARSRRATFGSAPLRLRHRAVSRSARRRSTPIRRGSARACVRPKRGRSRPLRRAPDRARSHGSALRRRRFSQLAPRRLRRSRVPRAVSRRLPELEPHSLAPLRASPRRATRHAAAQDFAICARLPRRRTRISSPSSSAQARELSSRNRGVGAEEQEALDRRVAEAFGLGEREREQGAGVGAETSVLTYPDTEGRSGSSPMYPV